MMATESEQFIGLLWKKFSKKRKKISLFSSYHPVESSGTTLFVVGKVIMSRIFFYSQLSHHPYPFFSRLSRDFHAAKRKKWTGEPTFCE